MIKRLCIKLIEFYQKKISPNLGHRRILKGFFRILRCNPFSKGGYDPLK